LAFGDVPRHAVSFGGGRALPDTLAGTWRVSRLDLWSTVRVVTTVALLVYLVFCPFHLVWLLGPGRWQNISFVVHELIRTLMKAPLWIAFYGMLTAVIGRFIYHVLAARGQPVRLLLAVDGEWLAVRTVDARALALAYAAATGAASLVRVVGWRLWDIACSFVRPFDSPLHLLVSLPHDVARNVLVPALINFVVAWVLAGFYNRLAPLLGGLRVAAQVDDRGRCTIHRVHLKPLLLTLGVTAIPWLAASYVSRMVLLARITNFRHAPAGWHETHLMQVTAALQALSWWLTPFARIVLPALAVRWLGGWRVTIEPDQPEAKGG
jgi:hypothetical protein